MIWTSGALGVEEDKPQLGVTLTLAAAGGGQAGKQASTTQAFRFWKKLEI